MKPFNIAQVLADAGVNNDTSARKQIEYISIDKLVPAPDNFYELSAIDDLAENIALFGLQQPIVVRPMPGDDSRYIIVSGHRRHAAILKLIQEDGRDDLREVWCAIDRGEDNPKLNELKLIYANSSTRVLSSAEQAKQAEKVEKLLYELKEEGMEFPGRMRDHVAAACNVSTGKLARLKVIRDGLAAEFVPSYESGELSESTAYELARMPQDEQNIIFSVHGDKKKQLYSCSLSHVAKEMQKAIDSIPSKACPASVSAFPCEELKARKTAAAKLHSWESLVCKENTCCLDCNCLPSCTHPCAEAKGKQKALRKISKDAEKESARRVEEQRQPAVDAIAESWKRMCSLAQDKGIDAKSVFTACRGWSCSSDSDDLTKYAEGNGKFAFNDSMPGNLAYESAKKLIATADLLGCSIDYLLGRTDTPDAPAAPGKCVQFDTWNSGYPDDRGIYAVFADGGGYLPDVLALEWNGEKWVRTDIDDYDPVVDGDIVGWVRLPDKFPSVEAEESK